MCAFAPSIGNALVIDDTGFHPTCARAASVWSSIAGWGGTEFLLKTPLRDVSLALSACGWSLPDDWDTWGPPGPGARETLERLSPRSDHGGRYERLGGQRLRKSVARYAPRSSAEGVSYQESLDELHGWLVRQHGHELGALLPEGRTWMQHDTQVHCCWHSKYLAMRDALIFQRRCPPVRLYPSCPAWNERGSWE